MTAILPGAASAVRFTVNGRAVSATVDGGRRLLDVLRLDLGLTGSKEGCGEGECGACAVLLDGELVNSCLVPVGQVAGRDVITIEGLATDGRLAPIQASFLELGGTQCGMCTPGMLMAAHALLGVAASRQATRTSARRSPATSAAAPGTRGSSSRSRRSRRRGRRELRSLRRSSAGGDRPARSAGVLGARRSGRRSGSSGPPPLPMRSRGSRPTPRCGRSPAAPTSWCRPPRTPRAGDRSST